MEVTAPLLGSRKAYDSDRQQVLLERSWGGMGCLGPPGLHEGYEVALLHKAPETLSGQIGALSDPCGFLPIFGN